MKIARLLVTNECNNNCEGCCNKDWKYEPPKEIDIEQLKDYDEILITGGEPLLFARDLIQLIKELREKTKAKIYIYTAYIQWCSYKEEILLLSDGITLTLHKEIDAFTFMNFNSLMKTYNIDYSKKSLRLNVFNPIKINENNFPLWKIKYIDWIKDCPLPENEEFFKLKKIWSWV